MVCFLNKAFTFILLIRCILLYVLPIVTELGWSTHGSFSATPSVSEGESSLKANSSNSSRTASNASQMEVIEELKKV